MRILIVFVLIFAFDPVLRAEEFQSSTYLKSKQSDQKIVLHFFADWCPTCHEQKRSLKKLEEAGKLQGYRFFEVNFDQEEGLKEDLKVFSQSSFVALRGEKELGRLVGNTRPEEIESFLTASFEAKGLNDQLAKKAEGSKLPADKKKIMEAAEASLRKSKILNKALKKGDTLPEFNLKNAVGKTVKLSELLAKGPLVMSFYRGEWCPYCNLQLQAYQKILPQIHSLGAQLVALSPEKPDAALSNIEKNALTFEVLSDTNNLYAKKLGLVFGVPPELKKLYLEFGIDLEKNQGNPEWKLPIPATYVVNQKGEITFSFIDLDYKRRAEPEEILRALVELSPRPKD